MVIKPLLYHSLLALEPVPEHIVLVGDSILDNAAYIPFPKGADVTTHCLRAGLHVTLLAQDGAVMSHVPRVQLPRVPDSANMILLSVGGNNGLRALSKLRREPWTTLTTFFSDFEAEYAALLDTVQEMHPALPLLICTIYQAQIPHLFLSSVAYVGVRLMNRIIRKCAAARGLPILDLWEVFDRREDYANAIEPGTPGGHKIVRNLLRFIRDGMPQRAVTYADTRYDTGYNPVQHAHFNEGRVYGAQQ